jgi:hypothetical protein
MDGKCDICSNALTTEEIDYFKQHDLIRYLDCGYLCKKHWCECMPNQTPWKWLIQCGICDNYICKTCKRYESMCSECYDCLCSGGRIKD